jgi:RimJ/RimL family protein N-acetyltransferase
MTDYTAADRPTLENAFVRLEPIEERHREPLRAAGAEPELWRFHPMNFFNQSFDSWFDHYLATSISGANQCWSVFDKASRRHMGSTSYLIATNIPPPARRVEIGSTWYNRDVWAGAVNPSCKRMLMAHGFEQLALNRVELKLDATNIRSFRAIARLGARFEGIHRGQMEMPDGRIRDTAWFSVLKNEWPAVRDGLDARLAKFTAP